MFGWYRSQIRTFGALGATLLLARVAWSRSKTNLANGVLPGKVECPCCGWSGRKFHDYIEVGYTIPATVCPRCDCQARHRALYTWLRDEYHPEEKKGTALLFAPEKPLASVWHEAPYLRIIRIDLGTALSTDLLADLQHLPIASNAIDIVWCHHVLEHVEDDRAAIRELHRILRSSTGELIASVPIEPGTRTREFGFADKTQSFHWRMYGDDFADRLAESGLAVRVIDYSLPPEQARLYGTAPERLFMCAKHSQ